MILEGGKEREFWNSRSSWAICDLVSKQKQNKVKNNKVFKGGRNKRNKKETGKRKPNSLARRQVIPW